MKPAYAPLRSGAPERVILVVDDELPIRSLIREILEAQGFRVLVAADGEEAVARSRSHESTIDMLITDLDMPRLRGPELVEIIQNERPDIGVLFMSGSDGCQARQLKETFPFLSKPFSADALESQVRQICGSVSGLRAVAVTA